jgi:predicted N-formylglutamate amidohydrolase
MSVLHVVISCEHGDNRVPARYGRWFEGPDVRLPAHRGYDPGALALGRALATRLHAPLFFTTVTRLLVEQNRSARHRQLFSAAMRAAPADVRNEVLARYYVPYRAAIEQHIAAAVARGERVLHVASHSFTPALDGAVRATDIGLLYDPARASEGQLCADLQVAVRARTGRVVRLNYPYRGTSDGLPTALRRRFPPQAYVGMELEVNQKHVAAGPAWRALRAAIATAFAEGIARFDASARATPPRDAPESARRSPGAAAASRPGAAMRASR